MCATCVRVDMAMTECIVCFCGGPGGVVVLWYCPVLTPGVDMI